MYCYFLCIKYILFAQMQNISIFFGPPKKINSSNAQKIISLSFCETYPHLIVIKNRSFKRIFSSSEERNQR